MKQKIFKMAELFCGPGGLALGAVSADVADGKGVQYKLQSVWANDFDEDSCKTYAKNIHNGDESKVLYAPIETVDLKKYQSLML